MDSWSPEDMRPGDNWREQVLEHVRRADFIVVLASAPSVLHGSSAARFEVGSASALGKAVFVVIPDKYSTRDLPDDLKSERVVFADIREPDRAAEKLASVVFADAV